MRAYRYFMATALLVGACGGKLGGHSVPGGGSVPSTPAVPGGLGGASGEVDPNSCGNYAAVDAGMKLKAFLQATKDLRDHDGRDREGRQAELHHDGPGARHARGRAVG